MSHVAWLALELGICNLTTVSKYFEQDISNLSRCAILKLINI